MEQEKLENKLFYSVVESLGYNPSKREVLHAYQTGINEAQAIADKGFNATCEDYSYGIKNILEENELWYQAFIKGYQHFANQGVNEDLSILFSNVMCLLHDRNDRLKSESNGVYSQDSWFGQDLRQKERRNVDFYQSILDLGNNPTKREVHNTFSSWCREADSMVDEFLQVDLQDQFSEYVHETVRWRHAFIMRYSHFVKYDLNKEVSNLFSKTLALLGSKKGIVCYGDRDSDNLPRKRRKNFDRETNYRREIMALGEKWRLQNEIAKE
ncbi:hypothetical protein HN385_00085 [archaeon]|jgi:hypothetical protein|nr:hypothetical protein [archaeon]MBT3450844.1 hypothetical protein [archaeon]MBT6869025.1 hypothetical protein [archaeon]MBT7193613.1 hypothetical protein [archaeon]MBT7380146.1 hypothetical protein [archaeon]